MMTKEAFAIHKCLLSLRRSATLSLQPTEIWIVHTNWIQKSRALFSKDERVHKVSTPREDISLVGHQLTELP